MGITMKKLICIIGIIAICCLAECQKEKKETKSREDNNVINQTKENKEAIKDKYEKYNYETGLSETESGFYFFSNSMRITYVDKESMEAAPLCFNPNCEHPMNDSCMAYVKDIRNLQLYHGKLYADITTEKETEEDVCQNISLYQMDLDGSNRKKVIELFNTEDIAGETLNLSLDWRIMDDIVYLFGSYMTEDSGIEYIDAYSLDSGKRIERVYENQLKGGGFFSASSFVLDKKNENIYYSISGVENKDGKDGFYEFKSYEKKFSLKKKTSELFLKDYAVGSLFFYQDEMYFKAEDYIFRYNMNNETVEKYMKLDGLDRYAVITADQDYLYINNNSAQYHKDEEGKTINKEDLYLSIYDSEHKKVDAINIPFAQVMELGGTDKIIFLTDSKCYYLDKNKIGTGELELIEIPGVK